MAKPIEILNESQRVLLEDGEDFEVAARARRRSEAAPWTSALGELASALLKRHPPEMKLPSDMVWAISDRRLFVWSVDRLTGKKPKELLGTLRFGTDVELLRIGGSGSGGLNQTQLSLVIRGSPFSFELPDALATAVLLRIPQYTAQPPG